MILMYHKVDIITPTIWWVAPDDLERHLDRLASRRFVFLEDYRDPDTEAVITFDDAYENVARHALPVLQRRGLPFEVFVIGSRIGSWNDFDKAEPLTRHMGLEHLEKVVEAGGRLQWHSATHAHLPSLSADALSRELFVPETLRTQFPAPHFRWFSYPGGAHNPAAVEVARKEFDGAVSVLAGEPYDRWQLNRVTVDRYTAF